MHESAQLHIEQGLRARQDGRASGRVTDARPRKNKNSVTYSLKHTIPHSSVECNQAALHHGSRMQRVDKALTVQPLLREKVHAEEGHDSTHYLVPTKLKLIPPVSGDRPLPMRS